MQLVYDQGRFTAWVDGELRMNIANIWCMPDSAKTSYCTSAPVGAGHAAGQFRVGGVGSAAGALFA